MTRSPHRKISLTAGWLYILTFVSIPTLSLYGSIHGPDYVVGAGPDTAVQIGGILEIIVALAGIGTAAALYPILKKQNDGAALALVGSRVLEAATIFAGVAFLLAVVSLRRAGVGPESLATGRALVTMYDRIFIVGQSLLPAVNDLLLGFLLYRSRLVPRALSMIGIVGGPLLIVGFLAMHFGFIGRFDSLSGLSAILVALFELSLGIWLVVKGFNPQAAAALDSRHVAAQ